MKERLTTLLCALGALGLFLAMFMRGDPPQRPRSVPRPSTVERGANGYAAARAWLASTGVVVRSLREGWDTLEHDTSLAPRGNLLIVTLPGTRRMRSIEIASLRRWIAAGNTLLVAATLSDAPDWAWSVGGLGRGDPQVLTGLEFETVRSRDTRRQPSSSGRLPAARVSEAVPNGAHPYFEGVRSIASVSDYAPQPRDLRIPFDGFALELAHLRATGEGAFWMRTRGEGRVLVSAFGTLWTQRALGRADNARLLSNIVATSTAANGAVIFDDGHQGVAPGYDAAEFYSDPRFSATIAIALVLWLAWVLGGTRLRPAPTRARGPSEGDLVIAGGALFARSVRPQAAAMRLMDLFAARVGSHGERHTPATLRAALARHPQVTEAELHALDEWSAAAEAGRRVPLAKLYNLLLSLERRIV